MFAAPALAANSGTKSMVGGGYWSLPKYVQKDTEGNEVKLDWETKGWFASLLMLSADGMLSVDYATEDPNPIAIAYDYLYPLSGTSPGGYPKATSIMSDSYIGVGYSYLFCDQLGDDNGFNFLVGMGLGETWFGTARYDIFGNSKNMVTIALYYQME